MKTKQFLVILLSLLLLGMGITLFVFNSYKIVKVQEFELLGEVGKSHGMGFVDNKIMFGKALPGGNSWTWIKVQNDEPFPVMLGMQFSGNISDFVKPEEDNPVFAPGEFRKLRLDFMPPLEAPYGNYSGTLRIIVKRI